MNLLYLLLLRFMVESVVYVHETLTPAAIIPFDVSRYQWKSAIDGSSCCVPAYNNDGN